MKFGDCETSRQGAAALLLGVLAGASTEARAACSGPIEALASPESQIVIDKDQRVSGLVGDLFQNMGSRIGCRFDYIVAPRARGLLIFASGEIYLVAGAVQTVERDQVAEFVPCAHTSVAAVGLSKRMSEPRPFDARLSGKFSVNVVRGYDYGNIYKEMVQSLETQNRLEYVASIDAALQKLALGRAVVIVAEPSGLVPAVAQLGLGDQIQAMPLDAIPGFTGGVYASRRSLGADDRSQLVRALHDGAFQKAYFEELLGLTAAWARATLTCQPARGRVMANLSCRAAFVAHHEAP